MKPTLWAASAALLAAIGFAWFEVEASFDARDALGESRREQAHLRARVAELETQVPAQAMRAQTVEGDNLLLQTAVQTVQSGKAESASARSAPLTHDAVEARYQHAKELARSGQTELALQEFLWCFDIGMKGMAGYGGVRTSYVLDEIAKLGPSGLAALEERRVQAEKTLLNGSSDSDAAPNFASISRKLNKTGEVLSLFDQMPQGDARRTFAIYASAQLVEAQRYSEVAAVSSYGMMSSIFEDAISRPTGRTQTALITRTATNIEVLAGSGDLAHAQTLMNRLLTYDSSDATKAIIQQHLERAGHPELSAPPATK
jgi:hypothetical protein